MIRAALALLALASFVPVSQAQSCFPPRAVVDLGGGCSQQQLRAVLFPSACNFGLALAGGTQVPPMVVWALSWNPTSIPLPWPPFPQNCVLPHDIGLLLPRSTSGAWMNLPTMPIPRGASVYLTAIPIFANTPMIDPLTPWIFATNTLRFDW
jgi:hypothetical protein